MAGDLKVLLRLLGLFRSYRSWMALGALLACITILANVGLMAVAGSFIAAMAVAGFAGVLINYFLPAASIRLLAVLRTGGRYAERLVSHEATFRLLSELRVWLFRRLEPLAPSQMQGHRGADLLSRLQADIDTLQHAYLRIFSPVVVALAATIMIVVVLAVFSVPIALVVLGLLLVAGVAVPAFVQRASARPSAAIVQAKAALRIAVTDALQGMTDLRVQGAASRKAGEIAALTQALGGNQLRAAAFGSLAEGAVGLGASLALWSVTLLAIAAVAAGSLPRIDVPMLALAAFASFELVAPLPLVMHRIGEIAAAARRVFALADEEPAIVSPPPPSPQPKDASVILRDVRLRYPGISHGALDGLQLSVASGRRLGVAGPSGAGKSSLTRILLRFWDYESGEVQVGGHDLRTYSLEALRDLVGVVSQETQLFNATIRENLLIAAPRADDAAIERVLRAVQLLDFIAALPDGYDTWIGEGGVRLSVGQARRLAVARVLLRNPPILILDEATEGLDAETARALLVAVDGLMAASTMIVITQKIEEVRDLLHEIAWMEQGRIVRREVLRS